MTDKQTGNLSLNVPEPEWRPGDVPDFSGVKIPRAGTVRRPEVDEDPEKMRDLAFTIIRVLNRDGEAVGPWAGTLTDEELMEGLRHMMLLRTFDARMLMAQRQGKASFYVQHLGEEAISCSFRRALSDGDMNFPTYRQAGLLIASGYPVVTMMNQIFSNDEDPLRGRQLPIMYSSKKHGFFSISGNLGTQFTQAVGWAMASAISGDTKIAAGWIGDGSTAENDFHASLVFASTYKAPVVLNIVNNQWAISTFQGIARARPAPSLPAATASASPPCVSTATTTSPSTPSPNGPSSGQDATWARRSWSTSPIAPAAIRRPTTPLPTGPREEGDAWPLGDPVLRLKNHLIKRGVWSEERHVQSEAQVLDEIIAAQKEAEAIGTLSSGNAPSPRDMFEDVYADMPPHLVRQRQEAGY